MMRWKVMVVGLALTLAVAAGCKQQIFLHECVYEDAMSLGLPPKAECDPCATLPPTSDMPAPTNVHELNRTPWNLTLAEAIAMALEHGTTGIQSARLILGGLSGDPTVAGLLNDDLVSFQGGQLVTGSDSIRVLALEPAISGADMEASLSKFDAFWRTSMTWNNTDQPPQGLSAFQNGTSSTLLTQLIKPLPTGGAMGVAFNTTYTNLSQPFAGQINPAYQTSLTFSFDQPLLQGFGVDINQLRQTHPIFATPLQNLSRAGTLANTGSNENGGLPEGILITRIRFDQSRAEFERVVNFMLANVEIGYWTLYDSYLHLYAVEKGLRLAREVWQISKAKFDAGNIGAKDYYPQLAQYEQFRGDRLTALGRVLDRERQLRGLLGLPAEDGKRLVPIDSPTLTPYKPDWHTALNEALALRPELIIARQDLKTRQLQLLRAKNDLLPDLRFTSSYGINGLGNRLDGNDMLASGQTANALRSLASDHFNNWSLGLTLNVPIGYRAAYASLRQARLRLAEGFLQVRDQEDKATRLLALLYRQLPEQYDTIQARRSQRIAYGEQLRARLQEIAVGKTIADLPFLDALRQWTAALQAEFDAITNYNNSLVGFEFAKGTIQQHDNVVVSEGPLPCCAQVRAVEHERQRKLALPLLVRANPLVYQPCCPGKNGLKLPELPVDHAPALPALLNDNNDRPEGESLPQPRIEQGGLKASKPAGLTLAPAQRSGSSLPLGIGSPIGPNVAVLTPPKETTGYAIVTNHP